jgi:hypothetical protein
MLANHIDATKINQHRVNRTCSKIHLGELIKSVNLKNPSQNTWKKVFGF